MANTIQEKIFEICDQLSAQNQKLNVRFIQSQVPEVQSTSTVHKYIKEWREIKLDRQKRLYEKLGFSQQFIDHFLAEVDRFNVEAEQRHRKIAEDAKEQCQQAIEDLAGLEESLTHKISLIEALESENGKLKADNATLINDHKAELDKNQATFDTTIQTQNEKHGQEVSRLTDALERAQEKHDELMSNCENLRTELAKSVLKEEAHSSHVNDLNANVQTLQKNNADLEASIRTMQTQHQTERLELTNSKTKLSTEHDQLVKTHKEMTVSFENLRTEHSDLSSRYTELQLTLGKKMSALEAQAEAATSLSNTRQSDIESYQSQIHQFKTDQDELRQKLNLTLAKLTESDDSKRHLTDQVQSLRLERDLSENKLLESSNINQQLKDKVKSLEQTLAQHK